MSEKEQSGENKKVFTIRGLDPELYERFARTARDLGTSVGELMNEAMRVLLSLIVVGKEFGKAGTTLLRAPVEAAKNVISKVKDFEVISNIGELTVSKNDLEALEKPVLFVNIRRLIFEDDVSWELIDAKIKGVKLVDEVILPKHIPKLSFAKKCSMVKKITIK